MAIAVMLDLPGVTREQYETARDILGSDPQPGNMVHVAGPTESGWRVVEVWESPAAMQEFFGSDLAHRAFEAARILPSQSVSFPVHTLTVEVSSIR